MIMIPLGNTVWNVPETNRRYARTEMIPNAYYKLCFNSVK